MIDNKINLEKDNKKNFKINKIKINKFNINNFKINNFNNIVNNNFN